jgi:hypothetical protein
LQQSALTFCEVTHSSKRCRIDLGGKFFEGLLGHSFASDFGVMVYHDGS